MNNLAERIRKLAENFDLYEYRDAFENDEAAQNYIKHMLTENRNIQTIVDFCNDILESEDTECHKEANQLKEILNDMLERNTENRIAGIIFEHGPNDYSLWKEFNLSKEDKTAIMNILSKYETDGCSIRGNRKEILEEIE